MTKKLTVKQVAEQTIQEMLAIGMKKSTIEKGYSYYCYSLVHFYESLDAVYYDTKITAQYKTRLEQRLKNGDLSRPNYLIYLKMTERMDEIFLMGKFTWMCKSRHKRVPLTPVFEYWFEIYLNSYSFHPNTREDISWTIHKHLLWLIQNNHSDFSTVTEKSFEQYVSFCSGTLAPGSVRNTLSYLRKFYMFLMQNDVIQIKNLRFLSTPIRRPEKIQPAATNEDIEAVLNQIDRNTPIGKRDYAMILLGVALGLRADDIVHLKLNDINWKTGTLKLFQNKTGEFVVLPLMNDVGIALMEYILNVRPVSEFPEVFLRAQAPFYPLSAGSAVGYTYKKYLEKAGIEKRPFDGKGFHSLRRRIGKQMTISGVSVITTAQVLGHSNLDSVKQYISLDSVHLKECALDFAGIEVTGGVF